MQFTPLPQPTAATMPYVFDPERLNTLRRLKVMDSPPDKKLDRITRMVQRSTGAPLTLISLIDDERQYFKSAMGLTGELDEERQTPLSHSFCKHVVESGSSLVVTDSASDPLVSHNGAFLDISICAYVGMPIALKNGTVLGALCVLDTKPREWNEIDIDTVEIAAEHVATLFDQQLLEEELTQSGTSESSEALPQGDFLESVGQLKQAVHSASQTLAEVANDMPSLHNAEEANWLPVDFLDAGQMQGRLTEIHSELIDSLTRIEIRESAPDANQVSPFELVSNAIAEAREHSSAIQQVSLEISDNLASEIVTDADLFRRALGLLLVRISRLARIERYDLFLSSSDDLQYITCALVIGNHWEQPEETIRAIEDEQYSALRLDLCHFLCKQLGGTFRISQEPLQGWTAVLSIAADILRQRPSE